MAEPGARAGGAPGAGAADEPAPFWESVALEDMSETQWESLCDGCGRCCLHKLEDEDTGELHFTSIACRLLDTGSCRCRDYPGRFERVPECLSVRPLDAAKLAWLPLSCAYRRLAEGRGLASWHPLVTGRRASTREAGVSVAGLAVPEDEVAEEDWEEHVIVWAERATAVPADG